MNQPFLPCVNLRNGSQPSRSTVSTTRRWSKCRNGKGLIFASGPHHPTRTRPTILGLSHELLSLPAIPARSRGCSSSSATPSLNTSTLSTSTLFMPDLSQPPGVTWRPTSPNPPILDRCCSRCSLKLCIGVRSLALTAFTASAKHPTTPVPSQGRMAIAIQIWGGTDDGTAHIRLRFNDARRRD